MYFMYNFRPAAVSRLGRYVKVRLDGYMNMKQNSRCVRGTLHVCNVSRQTARRQRHLNGFCVTIYDMYDISAIIYIAS